MRVISIDPGVTTGYCYGTIINKELGLKYCPFQVVDDVDELYNRLSEFQPDYIVMEDFEFRRGKYAGSGGGGLNLFPVQLIGVARLYEARTKCRLFLQKAATGKSYYTNPVLKKMGVYKAGENYQHAMDASRHLLQWVTFGFGNQFIGSQTDFAELVGMSYFK